MRRYLAPSATLAILVTGLAACGARGGLRADGGGEDGSGGGGPSSNASVTSTGTGAGGGGGEDLVCVQLRWAGDAIPISVPFAPLAQPELVRVGPDEVALVVRGSDGAGGLVTSLRVSGAFADGWAPTIGAADANYPTNDAYAVGEGDPGSFAFALGQPDTPERVLAQAEPGQNGSQLITYFTAEGGARAVARGPFGSYAVARGDAFAGVFVDVLDSWTPDTFVRTYGVLGCADTAPLAGIVPASDGAFLVASTADQPFDDCADPDLPGAPLAAHVHRLDAEGAIQGGAFSEATPVRELALAPRPGGAWLLLSRAGSPTTSLHALDDDGLGVGNPWTWTSGSDVSEHGLSTLRRGYALATHDAGELLLTAVRDGADFTNYAMTSANELGVQAAGKPSVLVDEERGRILVAVIDATSSSGGVRLMRADCGYVGE